MSHDRKYDSLVFAGDYGYIRQIETAIKSLCYHNSHLKIYVFNQDIPKEWFVQLRKRLASLDCQLIDVKLFEESFNAGWISSYSHIKPIAYARYFIPHFVEEDQVLYLDSDLVVTDSLKEILDLDLGEHLIGAARFVFGKGAGFNSGVMLINNKLWKETNLTQDLIEITEKEHARLIEGDQQVLNRVIGRDYLVLDDTYNFQIGFDRAAEAYGHQFVFDYPLHPLPKIIHYISPDKPWNTFSSGRLREVWWFYAGLDWAEIFQSPFRGKRLDLTAPDKKPALQCFTLTNTCHLLHMEYLIRQLPECHFSIAAYTDMAPSLLKLARFDNVTLRPRILSHVLKQEIEGCDLYLNVNQDTDFEQSVAELLGREKTIFSFDETSCLTDEREKRFSSGKPEELLQAIQNMV